MSLNDGHLTARQEQIQEFQRALLIDYRRLRRLPARQNITFQSVSSWSSGYAPYFDNVCEMWGEMPKPCCGSLGQMSLGLYFPSLRGEASPKSLIFRLKQPRKWKTLSISSWTSSCQSVLTSLKYVGADGEKSIAQLWFTVELSQPWALHSYLDWKLQGRLPTWLAPPVAPIPGF